MEKDSCVRTEVLGIISVCIVHNTASSYFNHTHTFGRCQKLATASAWPMKTLLFSSITFNASKMKACGIGTLHGISVMDCLAVGGIVLPAYVKVKAY
jgi:hypothetical protein